MAQPGLVWADSWAAGAWETSPQAWADAAQEKASDALLEVNSELVSKDDELVTLVNASGEIMRGY